jgi:Tol biopolymer transport system component
MNERIEETLRVLAAHGNDPGATAVWERARSSAARRRRWAGVVALGAVAVVIAIAVAVSINLRTSSTDVVVNESVTTTATRPSKDAIIFERDNAIWTIEPSGTGLRRLTPTGCCGHPAWSPDHDQIAFVHFGELAVMNADGSHVRDLGQRTIFSPTWSPDATQIAFADSPASTQNGGPLRAIDLEDGRTRTIVDTFAGQPTWSPNGTQIAYTDLDEPLHVNIVTIATSAVRTLTSGSEGETHDPAWSRDGTKILLQSATGVDVIAPDGTQRTKLIICQHTLCPGAEAAWSPDATRLVFVQTEGERRQLVIVEYGSGVMHQLTATAGSTFGPSW